MSTELVSYTNGRSVAHVPAPSNLDDVQRLAKMMIASGFFKNTNDLAKASVKILAGQELGISAVQSLMGIHFVNDRLTYEAVLLASALKRRGYDYRPVEITTQAVEIAFLNQGQEIGRSRFTIQDAGTAGLTNKSNWKNYPRNMLWARAMANGCRWFCADVFGGPVYVPEELGAEVDESGRPVDMVIEPTPLQAQQSEQAQDLGAKLAARKAPKPNEEFREMTDEEAAELNRLDAEENN